MKGIRSKIVNEIEEGKFKKYYTSFQTPEEKDKTIDEIELNSKINNSIIFHSYITIDECIYNSLIKGDIQISKAISLLKLNSDTKKYKYLKKILDGK